MNIAVMTYDAPEVNRRFVRKNHIPYPVLQDVAARHVLAFGIINEAYEPGHRAYGVPHPGVFLVDETGVIRAKFWEEGYRNRPPISAMLDAAAALNKAAVTP